MDRRHALQLLGALATSPFLASLPLEELEAAGLRAHAAVAGGAGPGTLTAAERALLAAAVDTIIPRTSTPGAVDLGVPAFAELMLASWYSAAETEAVRAGLAELDATARARHGRAFAALGERARLALLAPLDAAQAAARDAAARAGAQPAGPAHWFETLRFLAVWGWCTSSAVQQRVLHAWPLPGRYDPDARRGSRARSGEAGHPSPGHD